MWFVLLGAALGLLILSGLYVRRRVTGALAHFGVRERRIRIVRWGMVWLLFGYPLITFVVIVVSLLFGRATLPQLDGPIATWLLGLPFLWAVLVVVQAVPWLLALELVHRLVRARRGGQRAARVRAVAVLGVIAVFAVYTPARILVERGALRVRTYQLGASAATTSPPLRIAFLADVQQDAHTDAARVREVYARVNGLQPDLVLSGGDWINAGPEHITEAAAAAGTLQSRRGTFSVRGDHEHFAYVDRARSVAEVERAMRRHGVAMLSNEVRWFEHHGKRIAVVFIDYTYLHRTDGALLDALVARAADADYAIAVTHQLDAALAARLEGKVDLVLAGHTHGGQVNPVIGLWHVPLARIETAFVDGRYARGPTTIIVTAGIGYSLLPIRYAAPGSVELIELAL